MHICRVGGVYCPVHAKRKLGWTPLSVCRLCSPICQSSLAAHFTSVTTPQPIRSCPRERHLLKLLSLHPLYSHKRKTVFFSHTSIAISTYIECSLPADISASSVLSTLDQPPPVALLLLLLPPSQRYLRYRDSWRVGL